MIKYYYKSITFKKLMKINVKNSPHDFYFNINDQVWLRNGKFHRENNWAIKTSRGYREWIIDGIFMGSKDIGKE